MIIFWILAGGLLVLALVFIVTPLLQSAPQEDLIEQDALNLEVFRQRLKELDADLEAGFLDQDRYAAARHDLERELLYDVDAGQQAPAQKPTPSALSRWLIGAALVILAPISAVLIYLQLGEPRLADPLQVAASAQAAEESGQSGASLEELVTRLEQRLQENPEDIDGWLMLGRTAFATGKTEQGLQAIEKAYGLAPDEVDIKLAYAEALAAASPTKSLEGKPAELIRAVLDEDPTNRIARWLTGMIAFQKEQYASAVDTWEKILAELDPNGQEAANLEGMIAEAQTRMGTPTDSGAQASVEGSVEPSAVESQAPPAAAGDADIQVTVSLDASLADQASPEDTVFVFARAASGPPMPLAVQRLRVSDLPRSIRLDDSMAMTPAMRLSAFDQVVVGARVSKSGDAMPQSGDLFGETGPLTVGKDTQISVAIDQVRP
ncbi:c-type cytochrome biogenesis protein CcmI [Thiorhodococcus mannitoliphagus]|uniref:C-type cytochrome biogenesis protein CcmI n=1 Tax=Thiorhodococcus mannitoliphagus TaxID=329406 RepID=A0A6P1E050_9GAMM|nr:c-type cytochrome biogenesis protein CcmI [Thiorhodococcus mannitoliphagus]NEX23140.1 c-type cytochrome biogenesis protein CcmI [Thiorhodococcus mannitoliphagus]